MLPMRQGQCVVRVEEKAMLTPVGIGNLLVFWTRLAKSKANVRVEVDVPQEFTAVEPIIVSTCCCFKSCDIQTLFEGFGIAAIIQVLRSLLLIRCSTVSLQAICVCIFGGPSVIQNIALF